MASMSGSSGTLFVVSTPIGNLEDLSPRARRVLGEVDLIAAEDTRHTRGLLSRIGVETPTLSYHDHNESTRTRQLIDRLAGGEDIALVSDAGTPLISDPGFSLVREARAQDVPVITIPGPSAITAALSIAGLPTDRWVFEGFLPRQPSDRRQRIQALQGETRTLVFFESIHRLEDSLAALCEGLGEDRPAFIARELTKLHEEGRLATLGELVAMAAEDEFRRGEVVLVVGGTSDRRSASEDWAREVFAKVSEDLNPKDAIRVTSRLTGLSRNVLYRLFRMPSDPPGP